MINPIVLQIIAVNIWLPPFFFLCAYVQAMSHCRLFSNFKIINVHVCADVPGYLRSKLR